MLPIVTMIKGDQIAEKEGEIRESKSQPTKSSSGDSQATQSNGCTPEEIRVLLIGRPGGDLAIAEFKDAFFKK